MTRGNAEIVRAAMDAWSRGDWDTALEDAAPDFVFDNSNDLGEWRGVHSGPDQLKRVWEVFTEPWESVRFELDEVIEAGDHVVSRQSATCCGRGGIELKTRTHWVWTLHGGKVTRVETTRDRAEALEAAGLSE